MKKMKILLTGANGQVGKAIAECAKNYPVELIACDRAQLDITDEIQIKKSIAEHQPQFVINAAAYTAVDRAESEVEQAFLMNAKAVTYLAKACAENHISLIHFSTDYIFDGTKSTPYVETDTPCPMNSYGESKLAGEKAIQQLLQHYIILRVSWVFGKHGNNFVKTMRRLSKEKPELRVIDDQKGGPTPADDIAHTVLKMILANRGWGAIYHYCGMPYVSWFEFARAILQDIIPIIPITTKEYPTPAKRPTNSQLNCDKIFNTFGIAPADWRKALNGI